MLRGFHQILTSAHQSVEAHHHDCAKQQNHDAAHNWHGNGTKKRPDLAINESRMEHMAAQVITAGLNTRVRLTAPITSA